MIPSSHPFQSLGLVTHPCKPAKDGKMDLVIRDKDMPSSAIVPLFDHHEYDKDPIGFAKIAYIPVLEASDNQNVCLVTALITSNIELKNGQGLSMGAAITRSSPTVNIYTDVLEVSIVDVPHLEGCEVVNRDHFDDYLATLAPKKGLNGKD